jgi:uncharacterized protein YndB with AHSA1/START domain
MTGKSFTTSYTVDQSPEEVFQAITNVRRWWTGNIDGDADRLGGEFTYRYGDAHRSKQRVTELIPARKLVWHVLDAHLTFAEDPSEWKGTDITFELTERGGRTEVRFAHLGLVPEFHCFDSCSSGWDFYINDSLRRLITTGEGPMAPPWE